jgi:putative oxidoreductase
MQIKDIFATDTSARRLGAGLFILRVLTGLSLFLNHGVEKLTGYPTMVQHFPDPIHIGAHASLAYALITDGICSILVIFGLATRPAAGLMLINLLTAFFFVHHAAFFVKNSGTELIAVYIVVLTSLIFTGPGRFSIDARIRRSNRHLYGAEAVKSDTSRAVSV